MLQPRLCICSARQVASVPRRWYLLPQPVARHCFQLSLSLARHFSTHSRSLLLSAFCFPFFPLFRPFACHPARAHAFVFHSHLTFFQPPFLSHLFSCITFPIYIHPRARAVPRRWSSLLLREGLRCRTWDVYTCVPHSPGCLASVALYLR